MKRFLCGVLAALMLVVLCACGKQETATVRLSEVTHSVFYAPQYVALEQGFFADEGLNIELTEFLPPSSWAFSSPESTCRPALPWKNAGSSLPTSGIISAGATLCGSFWDTLPCAYTGLTRWCGWRFALRGRIWKCSQLRVKTLFMMRIICLTAESRTNLLNGRISGKHQIQQTA